MGHDAVNTIPKTQQGKVEEFLIAIGATKAEPGYFYFFKDEDYRYYQGVGITIHNDNKDATKIQTRTTIWCSEWDLKMQNKIIRLVKERFGGSFASDRGKNRYFRLNGENREKDEAGCFLAYESFLQSVHTLEYYLRTFAGDISAKMPTDKLMIETLGRHHPLAVSAAMAIPFLVSILESYYRDTFIALMKYRAKESFFRKQQIHKGENWPLTRGASTVFQAIAQSSSFQSMKDITSSFRDIDQKLDFSKALRKKYKKSALTLYDHLDRIFSHRHQIIHRAGLERGYLLSDFQMDLKKATLAVKKTYFYLISISGWRKHN